MKTIPLTLAKELLIVEVPEDKSIEEILSKIKAEEGKQYDFRCKGSDITEDTAADLVEKVMNGQHFKNYNAKGIIDRWAKNALDSFTSAVESKGFYWGENPYQDDWDELCEWGFVVIDEKICSKSERYDEAQAQTFNLSRTLIFERV